MRPGQARGTLARPDGPPAARVGVRLCAAAHKMEEPRRRDYALLAKSAAVAPMPLRSPDAAGSAAAAATAAKPWAGRRARSRSARTRRCLASRAPCSVRVRVRVTSRVINKVKYRKIRFSA